MANLESPGAQQLVQRAILALTDNAVYHADLVGTFLTALRRQLPPSEQQKPLCFSKDSLLELGAALRLAVWEWQGFQRYLTGLPPAMTAIVDVLRRSQSNFTVAASDGLLRKVLETWLTRFAWSGLEELGVDILLDHPGNEESLEDLASFLWTHRAGSQREDCSAAS